MSYPERPVLNFLVLPEDEHESANFVSRNLMALDTQVEELTAAINLYLWASDQARTQVDRQAVQMVRKWSFIGARAGALHLYGFYQALQGLRASLNRSPTLVKTYNKTKMKEAGDQFDKSFPKFAKIRLAAAHPAELSSTPEKTKVHALTEGFEGNGLSLAPGSSVFIESAILNGVYSATIENSMVSYKLHQESIDQLRSVADLVYAALEPSIKGLLALHRERYLKNKPPQQ